MPNFMRPKAAPPGNPDVETMSPDVSANMFSRTLFSWVFPLLKVGYSRPLQKEDLYALDEPRLSKTTTTQLEKYFYERVPPSRRPRYLRPANYVEPLPEPTNPTEKEHSKTLDDDDDDVKRLSHIGSSGNSSHEEGTLPIPATAASKPEKTAAEKKAEEKYKKKYPGNAEGGKVLVDGKVYDQSLVWALSNTFFWQFWSSAGFMIVSSLLQTFSPLVTKKLLRYLTDAYVYHNVTAEERAALPHIKGPGYGIGLAFALFVMQEVASLCQNQYMMRGMATGYLMRSALTGAISRKALRLSGAARVKHGNGHLITLVSSDCSFMDWAAFLVHMTWIQPMIIVIGMILLCTTLGYSALVGVAVLILNTPVQTLFVRGMFSRRQSQLKIVDQRVRLLQEVLNGIRVIKLYAFETFFKDRIAGYRKQEMRILRTISLLRAAMSASMGFMPILAAILSFITYSLSGHTLDAATIFSALQLFNVIRQPLIMLPMAFTISSDAYVAVKRIGTTLLAEELSDDMVIDPEAPSAIRAFGDFAWETSGPVEGVMGKGGQGRGGRDYAAHKAKKKAEALAKKEAKERKKKGLPPKSAEEMGKEKEKDDKAPFELRDIDVDIQRGSLTCIVGTVGSGKSSLLQALIGEMRKIRGEVVFGGTTAYVPQQPWVQNATVRDNILFGRTEDNDRFDQIVSSCALQPDIDILPNGLETEIGEKGINLSGGQKARVCLARAVYFDAEIILLDDPLSAVDAHVSQHLIDECIINGPLRDKTRFLVTHNLDILPRADHIIVMSGGRIVEQGHYNDLIKNGDAFSHLVEEYGTSAKKEDDSEDEEEEKAKPEKEKKSSARGAAGAAMMQEEEREVGAVSWGVYTHYARSMGSVIWAPLLIFLMGMAQVATVGNNIFLGFWSDQGINAFHSQGPYMAVYAAFGLAAGIFTFFGTFILYLQARTASYNLFNEALGGVMRSKVSWFDTTPLGRITSRMSKDITTLDNQLPMQWNQLLTNGFSVLGAIGLVIYTYNYLGIMFVPLGILYYGFATFYRASSREVKRLDSLLRSYIYTNFGEMLSGLASVRAYQQQEQFIAKTEHSIDVENRAYVLTVVLQRWLGIRLDFLGNCLVLGIALFGVGFRETVQPSKLGVVLTYSLSVTSVFSQLVSIFATVEQDMNTAERISHYAHLPSEGAVVTENDPPSSWPERGCIEFKDVRLRYREGLPEVLKGVSFSTRPGEKIGVVGRTGAGKSSLLQALFRIVEVSGGQITIDGRDLSTMGLDVLRKSIAVIPQEALLYAGTVRQNLDPIGDKSDADLNDALRRAGLIAPGNATPEQTERFAKFQLDATVADEGSNFSGGERQLLALCRALVKNSRVIILDEATSSVDVETDASVQRAIQTEFASQSLLCIAHRLATIAFYDRVLVMDAGQVVEFDEPLVLFDRPDGIFRSMCDKAGLARDDIVKIRRGAGKADEANVAAKDSQLP
ncbi:hypothetical protein FRB94_011257 [Tulasnella sp. JGI-2019a]|nr:hypothetical protein FRB93_009922 [Tulasnella sp. JGI-2019a]KAG8992867.1 hypothetical protein FRB94_011257 [Tulasnella sp. JGI-2019a]KAG9024856.1 hypothetical protein FRB95_010969 [Tulasnella sp. JGI-2019a]